MPQVTLEQEEIAALILLLEANLSNLSYEIADTDRTDFRDQLKSRRDVMNRVLQQLKNLET